MHTCNIKNNLLAVNAEYSYRATYSYSYTCNVYNMSGRVVSDIQTRAEGESLYIRYNTDANVVNNFVKLINNSTLRAKSSRISSRHGTEKRERLCRTCV